MREILVRWVWRESISAHQFAATDFAERRLCGLPRTGQATEARSAPSAARVLINDAGPTLVRVNVLLHRDSFAVTKTPPRAHTSAYKAVSLDIEGAWPPITRSFATGLFSRVSLRFSDSLASCRVAGSGQGEPTTHSSPMQAHTQLALVPTAAHKTRPVSAVPRVRVLMNPPRHGVAPFEMTTASLRIHAGAARVDADLLDTSTRGVSPCGM